MHSQSLQIWSKAVWQSGVYCVSDNWVVPTTKLCNTTSCLMIFFNREVFTDIFVYIHRVFWLQAKPHDTLDLCVLLNDDLAKTVRSHPKRFVGLGTLPMQAPDLAVMEMRRCVKELGFPGVQIGSHINNWDLNASELYPFYAVRLYTLAW